MSSQTETNSNQGNKPNSAKDRLGSLRSIFGMIIALVRENPLALLCVGSLVLAVIIAFLISKTPDGQRVNVAFVVLLCICILFFFTSAVILVIKLERKKLERRPPLAPRQPRVTLRMGRWNTWCDVIHSYHAEDYSAEAKSLAACEDTKFIFTFCAFNPTEIIQELARHIHHVEIQREKKAYHEKDYEEHIRKIRSLDPEEFRKGADKAYGHFRAFRDKTIVPTIKLTEQNPDRKRWVIRVLFLGEGYESQYENRPEKEEIYHRDFLKFKSINDPIPCFTVTQRLFRDLQYGLGTLEVSDYVIFFNSPEREILPWPQFLPKWVSERDLILDYYGESNTIIASSKVPIDERGRLFYYKILEGFRTKYRDSSIFTPLPAYMFTHFHYTITEQDRAIFNLVDITL